MGLNNMDFRLILLFVSFARGDDCSPGPAAPHSTNCTKYLICQDGVTTEKNCPEGHHFDTFMKDCLQASMAHCVTESTNETNTKPPEFIVPPLCNITNLAATTPSANETTYLATEVTTPATEATTLAATEATTLPTTEVTTPQATTCPPKNISGCISTSQPAATTTLVATDTNPSVIASQTICGSLKIGYIPDFIDCRHYYVCLFGKMIRKTCPEGCMFSNLLLTCLPEEHVICPAISAIDLTQYVATTQTISTVRATPYATNSTTPRTAAPITKTTTFVHAPYRSTTIAFISPIVIKAPTQTTIPTSLPQCTDLVVWLRVDPIDCAYYYTCTYGTLKRKICKPGYYFDNDSFDCLPKDQVNCPPQYPRKIPRSPSVTKNQTSQEIVPPDTTFVITPSTEKYTPLVPLDKLFPRNDLPRCGDEDIWIEPDLTNCQYYYACLFSVIERVKCKDGEFFDNITLDCTPKDKVECKVKPMSYIDSTPVSTVTPTLPIISTTPSATEATTPQPHLPECGESDVWLLAGPLNCTSYYLCVMTSLQLLHCPEEYLFDSDSEECLPQNEVNCTKTTTVTTTTPDIVHSYVTHSPRTTKTHPAIPTKTTPTDTRRKTAQPTEKETPKFTTDHTFTTQPTITKINITETKPHISHKSNKTTSDTEKSTHNPTLITTESTYPITRTTPKITRNSDTMNLHRNQITPKNYRRKPSTEESIKDLRVRVHTYDTKTIAMPRKKTTGEACEGSDVWFAPDPMNCDYYYICLFSFLGHNKCPEGYHFSRRVLKCLPQDVVNCSVMDTTAITTPSPTNTVSMELHSALCKKTNSWLWPDPRNCSFYYLCLLGNLSYMKCENGYHFSSIELKCLPILQAKCKSVTSMTRRKSTANIFPNRPIKSNTTIYSGLAKAPHTHDTTPKIYVTTPRIYATTPRIYATTPRIYATTPHVHDTTPKIYATTPRIYDTTPSTTKYPIDRACNISDLWITEDQNNCSYYYVCIHGVVRHRRCPFVFHFDAKKRECLPQHIVKCNVRTDKTNERVTAWTTPSTTTTPHRTSARSATTPTATDVAKKTTEQ